ncbi:MAG: sucrose synthase [Prochlorothrix sp.]|nr:sucrose synthase [Prochlorothrix sp.]
MKNIIQRVIDHGEQTDLRQFLSELKQQNKPYLLRNDLLTAFSDYCQQFNKDSDFQTRSNLSKLIAQTQEIIVIDGSFCVIIRPTIADEQIFHIFPDLTVEAMSVSDLLDLRDRLVDAYSPYDGDVLELDFKPFYDYTPKIRDPKNIGKGVQFLNRYMSSKLFQDPKQWLVSLYEFLKLHQYDRTQLLINGRIQNEQQLSDQVKQALDVVGALSPEEPYANFCYDLQDLGFEPGWGNTAGRIQDTLEVLDELIDSPDDNLLQEFISRVPMVFKVVLVSVHGWFGQEGVLGRPDTGGQVVYVLDQARSLEQEMQEEARLAGLGDWVQPKVIILTRLIPNADGTLCNQPLEKVHGTQNAWILRVPFREFNPELTKRWISRFEIWPYLETFTVDAEREIRAEFQGLPDLIIGNYSDGNLVASLLSRRMGVTQCNIAHALEKSKYLFSNLYWQDLEDRYHFSLQFTADLIAMNSANFIVSSTYQEIVGRPDSVGQYESYKSFTMPNLYHVVNGIELFSPKFNVVPPGVNENAYFPFSRLENRDQSLRDRLETLLFTETDPSQIVGHLDDPNKRPLFSMARLDRIKNLTGLAECFGQSPQLQESCNLIMIAGKIHTQESGDHEEIAEIEKLYRIIDQYQLQGKIRWLGVRLPKEDSGEVYRIIADRQGIFIQPALFEAFGLTILEAMISGLPTFATRFGGPLEIIKDQVNGFYINPTHLEETAAKITAFVEKCDQDPQHWETISQNAIDRVYSTYTWKIHCARLVSLAKIYGFWNYNSKENREDLLRYIEMMFYLLYKPRAQKLLQQHLDLAA